MLHAYCAIDKDNATKGTKTGEFLLVVRAMDLAVATAAEQTMDLEVWGSQPEIDARILGLVELAKSTTDGTSPPVGVAPVGTLPLSGGLLGFLTTVKRQTLCHISTLWRQLLFDASAPAAAEIGKEFMVHLAVPHGDGSTNRLARVKAKVVSLGSSDAFFLISY